MAIARADPPVCHPLLPVSTSRRTPSANCRIKETRVPRIILLGKAGSRFRGPRRAHAHRRIGPGGPRRQPHRAHVHRRFVQQLAVRSPPPLRIRQPGRVGICHRRARTLRLLRHRRRPLRPTAKHAYVRGTRCLSPISARGSGFRWDGSHTSLGSRPQGGGANLPLGTGPRSSTALKPSCRTGPSCCAPTTPPARIPTPGASPWQCGTPSSAGPGA